MKTDKTFFPMEMKVYAINIKPTVTWHHDYHGCKKSIQKSNS